MSVVTRNEVVESWSEWPGDSVEGEHENSSHHCHVSCHWSDPPSGHWVAHLCNNEATAIRLQSTECGADPVSASSSMLGIRMTQDTRSWDHFCVKFPNGDWRFGCEASSDSISINYLTKNPRVVTVTSSQSCILKGSASKDRILSCLWSLMGLGDSWRSLNAVLQMSELVTIGDNTTG